MSKKTIDSQPVLDNPNREKHLDPDGLTPRQRLFVEFFVISGQSASDAATSAGYSSSAAGRALLDLPKVGEAVRRMQCRLIQTTGSRIAWRTMSALMTSAEVPHNVRFQAAKWTLEAAGQGLAARIADSGTQATDKPLIEMSLQELEAFIDKGRQTLNSLKDVTPAIPVESQVVDTEG